MHRRGSRRDDGGWREGRGVRGTAAMSEEALKEQQTKIEALEDQLAVSFVTNNKISSLGSSGVRLYNFVKLFLWNLLSVAKPSLRLIELG